VAEEGQDLESLLISTLAEKGIGFFLILRNIGKFAAFVSKVLFMTTKAKIVPSEIMLFVKNVFKSHFQQCLQAKGHKDKIYAKMT